MSSDEDLLEQLRVSILAIDEEATVSNAEQIVASDVDVLSAVRVASAAITEIGDQFQSGEIYLPQLMLAGKAMRACMKVLSAHFTQEMDTKAKGKVVIGAVSGDIHDIGKNLVGSMLSVHGFDVVDLGVNVPPRRFLDTAESVGARIIALSSLMTTSMPYQRDVLDLLHESGDRERFFVVVGGGPVTPEFARDIGADGYGLNAISAVKVCEKLVESGDKPASGSTLIEE